MGPPDTPARIVDELLRYVHGEAVGEAALDGVMRALGGMDAAELRTVEARFLDGHADYTRAQCLAQLAPFAPFAASPAAALAAVLRLWADVVMPPALVPILTAGGLATMRRVFAVVVGTAVEWEAVVAALARGPLAGHAVELRTLSEAGLEDAVNRVLAQCLPREIGAAVAARAAGRYGAGVAREIEAWLCDELVPLVRDVLAPQMGAKAVVPAETLYALAWEALARLRINELYSIVSSANAEGLADLRRTLTTPQLRNEAVASFVAQCRARLLNGGADTVEIIAMYLQTIKGFSVLDPQGVLLERVCEPIQRALKERADTSAVIAAGLFGDAHSPLAFLARELEAHPPMPAAPCGTAGFDDWRPDPVDAPVAFVRKQAADSVATLINLYDNKEVFVKQFSALYSAELLNAPFDAANTDTVARLEKHYGHLVHRFGESHLHKIGVMLEDMRASQETAARIHAARPELNTVSGVVLSRLYWPALSARKRGAPLQLPPRIEQQIRDYAQAYQDIEGDKALAIEWLPDRGRVSLEVELDDRKLDLVVEPEQAVLISAFADAAKPTLALEDLLARTRLDEPTLLAAIQFWVAHSVIGTHGEEYKILETRDEAEAQHDTHTHAVTATDLGGAAAAKKTTKDPFEDMQVYWSYIKGMLTNLGALPLEKIHSFLVLFVPNEDPYVKTKQELESYLLAMVDEEKLQHSEGKFSLPKKS